jgi:hypothetical protein
MRRNAMKEKTIVIEIDEQGNCSMDLEGFHGKGCSDVARTFQGSDVIKNVRNKPDFYIQQTPDNRQRQQS